MSYRHLPRISILRFVDIALKRMCDDFQSHRLLRLVVRLCRLCRANSWDLVSLKSCIAKNISEVLSCKNRRLTSRVSPIAGDAEARIPGATNFLCLELFARLILIASYPQRSILHNPRHRRVRSAEYCCGSISRRMRHRHQA